MKIEDWRHISPIFNLQSSIFFILLLATALRFYALTASSLWSDEGNTWALMGRSFAQIARDAAADIHPPGYYWLLKLWTIPFGESAWALRSFSALLGVALVALVFAIARQVTSPASRVPLLAALLAALAPFQIYYSQEARMYMLLAVCSAGLVWSLGEGKRQEAKGKGQKGWMAGYFVFGVLGLWTHYSFPIILAAVAGAHIGGLLLSSPNRPIAQSPNRPILNLQSSIFIILNLALLLTFAPWLPTAVDRVLNWPAGGASVGLVEGVGLTLQSLTVGPIRSGPALAWPWLALAGVLPIAGILRHRHNPGVWIVAAWFLAPIGLMFGLGLFSDAFLKFLLAASPAWCVLAALAGSGQRVAGSKSAGSAHPVTPPPRHLVPQVALALAAIALAVVTLPGYYADPAARDNYAGVARYIDVLGDPAQDLVILNAPGQSEVWAYYDPGLPVLALPAQRPPDAAATQAALAAATTDRRRVYALFWATEQADPDGIVEGWLDQHAFKGADSWQGNVRFVPYDLFPATWTGFDCTSWVQPFGDAISLNRSCLSTQQVTGGESARVLLEWQAVGTVDHPIKVTVQLLDSRNQVIAQRDGEPGGGSWPSAGWMVGEMAPNNFALPIPLGTPPGAYRLIAALYDPETGQRVLTPAGDAVELGTVQVLASSPELPLDIVPMQRRTDVAADGDLRLVGYDIYRKEFGHAPGTPVQAGDLVHVTLFWQAVGAAIPMDQHFTLALGEQRLSAPLAGGGFPTDPATWPPGILVRGEFDIPYDGGERILRLDVGQSSVNLGQIP